MKAIVLSVTLLTKGGICIGGSVVSHLGNSLRGSFIESAFTEKSASRT
jgi:glucokinase